MDLLKLEQQRLALETSLQQLRQSLKHWHTWEAEYEGLKEDISGVNGEITGDGLTRIAETYGGELVNEKEIRDLAGLDKDSPRSAQQIIGLIERRQEYVQKNIETVQRQFFDAEAKSEELAFAAASQGGSEQGGLPLTEIHEELDEEGNVISSSLSQPEEHTAKVVDSLRKAGLSNKDLQETPTPKPKPEDLKPAITNVSPPVTPTTLTHDKRGHSDRDLISNGDGTHEDPERPPLRKKSVSFAADTKTEPEEPRPECEDGRKSVSFAKKVAVMPAAPPPDARSVSFSPKVEEIPPQPLGPASPNVQPTAGLEVQTASGEASKPTDHEISMMDNSEVEGAPVIVPDDESPEDAQTRREMLEYHLNEVGNVVAQIDLDEAGMEDDPDAEDDDNVSFYTTSEYLGDEDTPYTTGLSESEGEEEEDNFGRTRKRVVSEDYHQQMQDLEQRLIGNLGPVPKDEDIEDAGPNLDHKDVRRLVIRDKRNSTSSASSDNSEKKSSSKKRVSFAESLDVAEPGSPPLKAQKLQGDENVAPVPETISERTTATHHSLPERMSPERVSRFKKARAAPITHTDDSEELPPSAGSAIIDDTDYTPSGPPGIALANTLLERTPAAFKSATAPSPDDLDPVMQRRELAAEYYRRRNDMIRQQGGFKADEDEEEAQGELMEERDGRVRKVSRFKAARIRPSTG